LDEYKVDYTDNLINALKDIPFKSLSQIPHIKSTAWAPLYNPELLSIDSLFSDISIEYLEKIAQLANTNNIAVRLVPCPVSQNKKTLLESMIKATNLNSLNALFNIELYLSQIVFLPDDEFIDGIHLKNPKKHLGSLTAAIF
jgi:hypothetical protein